MQILRTGDLVIVRRGRWRVVDVRPFERCQIVPLRGAAPPQTGAGRRLWTPSDPTEPARRRSTLRFVGGRLWRRACRALIARTAPPGSLRAARIANVDLLPYQLEPAMAIVRGLA